MCLCWDFHKDGTVGMCSMEELRRRIHDPNFQPELKEARRKMIEQKYKERADHFSSLSEERKEKIRQEWKRIINK